jgi:O-antigen biosynthesis protein WbqV
MKHRQLAELLGRSQRVVSTALARPLIEGRRVLITGAGGSIGTELAIRVAKLGPSHLTLVNHSEIALYHVAGGLSWVNPSAVLLDVRDEDHVLRVFEAERPDVVFHAAALKHVPLCEENPDAAVLTNVRGSRNVMRASCAVGASTAVLISTDKAVGPTSVMGATKRVAERLFATQVPWPPDCKIVRFGNVLGSSGSVLPAFKHQLATTGKLTVTHPDVERYFMTVREAVGLTLAAATLPGRLFVLDMGEPVRIADLARRFAATQSDLSCEIEFTGLRPGEKLMEELFYPSECPRPTEIEGVLEADVRPEDMFDRSVAELEAAAAAGRTADTLRLLWELTRWELAR